METRLAALNTKAQAHEVDASGGAHAETSRTVYVEFLPILLEGQRDA
jgi:hypothetical protein